MALNKLPPLDKSGSSSKTETKNTVKLQTKKRSLPLAILYDKNMEEQEPTEMTIKTNKSASDDQNCSTMTVALDGDSIPRKNKKETIRKFNHREYNNSRSRQHE